MVGGASRPQTESPNSIRRSRPQAISLYSSNRNARAPKRPAPSPARVRRASWANLVVDRLKSHGPVVVATASASYHVDKEELPLAPIVRCSAGWRRPYERL